MADTNLLTDFLPRLAVSLCVFALLMTMHALAYTPMLPRFDTRTACGAAAAWAAKATVTDPRSGPPPLPSHASVLKVGEVRVGDEGGLWLGDPTAWSGTPAVRVLASRGTGDTRTCVLSVEIENPTVLGERPSYWSWTEDVTVRRADGRWAVERGGER
jgi:hypothetical protein